MEPAVRGERAVGTEGKAGKGGGPQSESSSPTGAGGLGGSLRSEEPAEKRRAGPLLNRPPLLCLVASLFSPPPRGRGVTEEGLSLCAFSFQAGWPPALLRRRLSPPPREALSARPRGAARRRPAAPSLGPPTGGPRPKEAQAPAAASHGPAWRPREGRENPEGRLGTRADTQTCTGAHVHANWSQRHAQQFLVKLWLVDEAFIGVVQAACSAETEDLMANCNV